MAGIGFALRAQLRKETYAEVLRAYLVAGVIGSGPWLISIASMLFIGVFTQAIGGPGVVVTEFLATVTHLMALSLIAGGVMQLLFVRFVADRIFQGRESTIAANIVGALTVTTIGAGILGGAEAIVLFDGHFAFRAIFTATFVTLCDVWLLSALLSGMKAYRGLLGVVAAGYLVSVLAALSLARFDLAGYLAGFLLGHVLMLAGMLALLLREYPGEGLVAFDFLRRRFVFPDLALIGFLFNVAIWVDKFVFWASPITSERLIGPIRYSVVYDVPIFVAYLSVIPGMSVFFVRIETDFAEAYESYFRAVREGAPLAELHRLRDGLVTAARAGVYDILRIQGMTVVVLLLVGERLLGFFRIPFFYGYLFRIDVVGVGCQVFLLGLFTILFYLDYRKLVLALCALFAASNLALSLASLRLGPVFYGFGFAVAAALTSLVALSALSRRLDRLEYETFMR
jgi:polysaccharide biosynthesis protein PelG